MNSELLRELSTSIQNSRCHLSLEGYSKICDTFLSLLESSPTKIISPSHHNYIFFQYDESFGHKITRPLNSDLFIESKETFRANAKLLMKFLDDLKEEEDAIINNSKWTEFISNNNINKMVYTIQQSIGCIADSMENSNQARKLHGEYFGNFIISLINKVGIKCKSKTIKIPIPGYPNYKMSYQLDLVFSRNNAFLTSETPFIQQNEIIGSVKTTSKDRIDKIFLDKYLLSKLIGRDIPVVAIFLHDVQRASGTGGSRFRINSTFKSGHFLGYTVALNRLDGVYYVDPRPDMVENERLREQISNFQQFLITDLWNLSK